jgi:hypothetical protein
MSDYDPGTDMTLFLALVVADKCARIRELEYDLTIAADRLARVKGANAAYRELLHLEAA